ncbi:hypothetical protein [Leifsonia sp. LS-T14]|uniref:hypothetical protein n=1 Tax=unclassified Leifsonia TaxID=2663824 RepID=UPI0035A67CC1
MSQEPILLFLHGVGDGDRAGVWKTRLNETLLRLGYPGLPDAEVIAPQYAHALKGTDDDHPLPVVTIKPLSRDAARQNRRDFERRMAAVEFRIGRHESGSGYIGGDIVIDAALRAPQMEQARKYLQDRQIRAHVLTRILDHLPESGRLVIVGHSLGSVIAADLLSRLPVGLQVTGMVTIGSPLASARFDVDKLRDALKDPPTNLAWWLNIWNEMDPVVAMRGVSSVFPWMVDFRIRQDLGKRAHSADLYLGIDSVGEAIGFGLFGSLSKEIVVADTGVDIALDEVESMALLALRYAELTRRGLSGDLQDRFTGALRQVQAMAVAGIRARNAALSRPMPRAVGALEFDLSDPMATCPEPPLAHRIFKEQAIVPLTVLATENILRPFEISVDRNKRELAMTELAAEMGLGTRFGKDVFAAVKEAKQVLSGAREVNWVKWGAMGAGAALLVVATGGMAMAAGAGLVGAAAITSALAAFGPGGMIGGLVTAGALVTAGGGGIAFGLASPGTTAETLVAVVERQLAAEIVRLKQGLSPDPGVWKTLVETEIEVRRQHERLDEFSDESGATLKELKRKLETLERAISYLRKNNLERSLAR